MIIFLQYNLCFVLFYLTIIEYKFDFTVKNMCYILLVYHFYEPIDLYLFIKTNQLQATTYQYYSF